MFRRLIPLAVIAASALAAPASAQMGPPPMEPGGFVHRDLGPPSPQMEKMMAEHRAQMARDMHIVLRLRPDQEAAWSAFEAAMAPPKPPESGPAMMAEPQTTPERLDLMKQHGDEMAAHMARHAAAVKAFYAALSPEQQQVFDAVERLRGPHGPGGGPRMLVLRRLGPGGPEGGPPHD